MKRGIRRKVEALWAQIPDVECKGRCFEECGPISMSHAEWRIIEEETGAPVRPFIVSPGQPPRCPYLTEENRCSIYPVRPAICRAFGAVAGLECGHGCRPARPFFSAALQSVLAALRGLAGDGSRWLAPADWTDLLALRSWGIRRHELALWRRARRKLDHGEHLDPDEQILLNRARVYHVRGEAFRKGRP